MFTSVRARRLLHPGIDVRGCQTGLNRRAAVKYERGERMANARFILFTAAVVLAGPASAAIAIDQNQPNGPAYMAAFEQTDLAQSFQQSTDNVAGAGIFLQPGSGSGSANITIGLWSHLPNAGGALLASGTETISGDNQWVDVFWSPVGVTPGATEYLVFTSDTNSYGISGDTSNPYPYGYVFANPGYEAFTGYDYTFRTYTDTTYSAVPETSTWLLMLLGFAGLGVAGYRQTKTRAPNVV
jgi:hypothetical protein